MKASRPRGRPGKIKSLSSAVEPVIPSSLDLGEVDVGNLDKQFVVFDSQSSKGPPGGMTRARAALALGVQLGLTYDSFDEVALQGIADNIRSRSLRRC